MQSAGTGARRGESAPASVSLFDQGAMQILQAANAAGAQIVNAI
jgi:hypothetical protein